jgi:hypothetical protein
VDALAVDGAASAVRSEDFEQLTWWILDVRTDVKVIRRMLEDEYGWENPEENS